MRIKDLMDVFRPLEGLVLDNIADNDRVEEMARTMDVIRGWKLARVTQGRVEGLGHPQRVTNTHLHFSDNGAAPEFIVSLRARDVHKLIVRKSASATEVDLLMKRGHLVTVELVE